MSDSHRSELVQLLGQLVNRSRYSNCSITSLSSVSAQRVRRVSSNEVERCDVDGERSVAVARCPRCQRRRQRFGSFCRDISARRYCRRVVGHFDGVLGRQVDKREHYTSDDLFGARVGRGEMRCVAVGRHVTLARSLRATRRYRPSLSFKSRC
jgi:hypothetical protein